jgi:hypothetical protein
MLTFILQKSLYSEKYINSALTDVAEFFYFRTAQIPSKLIFLYVVQDALK